MLEQIEAVEVSQEESKSVRANTLYSQWHAKLSIELEKNIRGTRIARCHHKGPLYIQKPFYPEGRELAHLYLLHPPGGMVSGDHLEISLKLKKNAQGLLTTPGAGRAYRARESNVVQRQTVSIELEPNATMEYFPLENIFYPGANASVTTRFTLAPDSRLFAWDVSSYGLPAQQEVFNQGAIAQRFELWFDGKPALIEHLRQDCERHDILNSKAGFRTLPINGTFIAGPFATEECESLIENLREMDSVALLQDSFQGSCQVGISWVNQFIVARYLGCCSEQAKNIFTAYWQYLRPHLLQREASLPRIWST